MEVHVTGLEWMPALAVGNEVIDAQHRKLFELINRLGDSSRAGGARTEVAAVLDELGDYVRDHFGLEERLFAEKAYPAAKEHQAEHLAFVARVSAFRADFSSGKAKVDKEVLDFLKSWLTRHISMTDRKYRPWLGDAKADSGRDKD
jgi:hemerythrin-like metal-binding protein